MANNDSTYTQPHDPPKVTLVAIRDIPDRRAKTHIKNNIRAALNDPESGTAEMMEPYLTNGGVTGHSMMDMAHAVQILLKDVVHGPGIRAFKMKEYEVSKALVAVLREKFTVKRHKITEVRPDLLQLMKQEKPEEPNQA